MTNGAPQALPALVSTEAASHNSCAVVCERYTVGRYTTLGIRMEATTAAGSTAGSPLLVLGVGVRGASPLRSPPLAPPWLRIGFVRTTADDLRFPCDLRLPCFTLCTLRSPLQRSTWGVFWCVCVPCHHQSCATATLRVDCVDGCAHRFQVRLVATLHRHVVLAVHPAGLGLVSHPHAKPKQAHHQHRQGQVQAVPRVETVLERALQHAWHGAIKGMLRYGVQDGWLWLATRRPYLHREEAKREAITNGCKAKQAHDQRWAAGTELANDVVLVVGRCMHVSAPTHRHECLHAVPTVCM